MRKFSPVATCDGATTDMVWALMLQTITVNNKANNCNLYFILTMSFNIINSLCKGNFIYNLRIKSHNNKNDLLSPCFL